MLEFIKQSLAYYLVIPVILLTGLYFSWVLRFIQFSKIYAAIKYTLRTSQDPKKFSSASALAAVLGGNLGTGNIAGIGVALTFGGPGSLFWMIIMVTFGSIIKFCCCFLGIKYREKDLNGYWVGGPMYYLSKGLNCKHLDKIFCILLILAAISTGNFIQIHSITLPLDQANISPIMVGIVMAVLVGLVMLGGLNRFSRVITSLVPLMALFYITACIKILYNFKHALLPSIELIMQQAFCLRSATGAAIGGLLLESMRVGFDRGIMATDTGIGIAPMLHAKVVQDRTVDYKIVAFEQGLISMLAPWIVLSICLLTGMVLLVTGSWQLPLASTKMCLAAFKYGLNSFKLAMLVVNVTLCLFAFTTILTWGYCADNAVQYLFKDRKNFRLIFKIIFVLLIPFGQWFEVGLLWNLADIILNLMLLINMYGVCSLFRQIVIDLRAYSWLGSSYAI